MYIIAWYDVVASLKSLKIDPLTFLTSGICFGDVLKLCLDWHRHLAIILHTFTLLNKWPQTGVKFCKLLHCKVTRGPKWRCFRKHLASLHQNIKKWQKTGGNFLKLLQQTNCCINKCPGRVHLDLLPHCTPLHRHNKAFHFFPRDKILYPSEIMKKNICRMWWLDNFRWCLYLWMIGNSSC